MTHHRRPLLAGDALALVGGGLGSLLVGATTGRWAASLVPVAVAALVIALDVVRVAWDGRPSGRPWRGLLAVLDFDVFALGVMAGAWAAAGGGAAAAAVLGALAVLVGALGFGFRRQVLASFMVSGSSPPGLAVALVPALGAVGAVGGMAVAGAFPGAVAPAIVMTAGALYVLLFAQAALLKVLVPGWQPPAGLDHRTRPPFDPRRER